MKALPHPGHPPLCICPPKVNFSVPGRVPPFPTRTPPFPFASPPLKSHTLSLVYLASLLFSSIDGRPVEVMLPLQGHLVDVVPRAHAPTFLRLLFIGSPQLVRFCLFIQGELNLFLFRGVSSFHPLAAGFSGSCLIQNIFFVLRSFRLLLPLSTLFLEYFSECRI